MIRDSMNSETVSHSRMIINISSEKLLTQNKISFVKKTWSRFFTSAPISKSEKSPTTSNTFCHIKCSHHARTRTVECRKGCHDNLFVNFMLMKYEVYADFACRCSVGGVGWRVGIASHAVKTSKQSRDRVRRSPKWNSSCRRGKPESAVDDFIRQSFCTKITGEHLR